MLQNFQQQPVKPDNNAQHPQLPVHNIQPHGPNVTAGPGVVAPQPPLPVEPTQQKTAFDRVAVQFFLYFHMPYKDATIQMTKNFFTAS